MNTSPAHDELSVDELRQRLAEAEATLEAIREGEADALVMRSDNDDVVFALADGEESYRAIMEAMDIGAVALDEQERVLYANAAFCSLLGCSAPLLQDAGLFANLDAGSKAIVRETISLAREGRHQTQFVHPHKGRARHLIVTAAPLPLAFSTGSALTFTDVTARVEAEAVRESERMERAVLASANEAVVVCNSDGVITNANEAAANLAGSDPIGKNFVDAFPLEFPIGAAVLHPDDLVSFASKGHALRGVEAATRAQHSQRDLLVSVAPLRLADEIIGGCVITMVDLTERKAIEKRQTLLMHELVHRVKNTLAMVLSISTRTIAGASDLDDFRERFTSRILALAATHTLLAQSAWAGVQLDALIRTELAPYISRQGPRLDMRELPRSVSPDLGIAFGLVIHELATNAVKYGALSRQEGCVTVISREREDGLLEVVWTESGGPAVAPPDTSGFGQTLITRSLRRGEGTGASLDFMPSGVVCTMVIPAEP